MMETTSVRQLVTFALDGDVYAVGIESVAFVVAAGAATRVPLADSFIDGLANVRGALMPVVDGVRWASGAPRAHGAAGKIVVLRQRTSDVGLAVDRMLGVAEAREREIAPLSSGEADIYEGLYMREDTAVRIFRVQALFDALKSRKPAVAESASLAPSVRALRSGERDDEAAPQQRRMLRFETNGEQYGLDMGGVRDILPMPEKIVGVQGLPSYAMGTGVYRNGTAMPIVHLGALLLGGAASKPRRVVCAEVATPNGREIVGLAVDWVHDLQAPREDAAARFAPSLESYSEMVRGVTYASSGAPMFVLDEERLLGEGGAVSRLLPSQAVRRASAAESAEEAPEGGASDNGRLYVFFQACGQEYGMPAGDVKEVRRLTRLTPVPHAPAGIVGVANVRGRILTVVGAQAALELGGERERTAHLIVAEKDGAERGIAVPRVTRVVRIPPDQTKQGFYHCSRDRKLVPLVAPSAFR
ncbi:chemotaxis protein CheW [Paenibacillus antri]|uniref:Chemotaxis protein CheW n=1 Tax=Paenibacillus antri TaxID=2582848 RepID=A0A5R9G9U5_9BACL|nr:chemotaxis protein CheW [Paenibacillus antri]TLS49483.1 chemotaxis protein CheW [Paenibacillus antri]